ncbi:hypothetical protein N665_0062s0060 [Sinapis alba]|nr:hypothetical protein N665_0062s0060 [Sinapis alba]
MKSVSFKLFLLISILLVTFRQHYGCETSQQCMEACKCDAAYCDIRFNRCHFGIQARNKIIADSSQNDCNPKNKNCVGGGHLPTN